MHSTCFGLGTSTHVCSWSIIDRNIIKWHVSHAWYWFWTIKALVKAEVLWWLYSALQGHSSSIDHCQTFSAFTIRLAKNLFLRQKCFTDIGCAWLNLWLAKELSLNNWQQNFSGKNCLSISDVHQCIVVIVYHCILFVLGDQALMHHHEADWIQTGGHYGKARLKEVLHAPPCTSLGQHRWSCVMMCSTQLWKTHCSVTIHP